MHATPPPTIASVRASAQEAPCGCLCMRPCGRAAVQASWVKMGPSHAAQLLAAGCNDMGGSIMNESITRAAGEPRHTHAPQASTCSTVLMKPCMQYGLCDYLVRLPGVTQGELRVKNLNPSTHALLKRRDSPQPPARPQSLPLQHFQLR